MKGNKLMGNKKRAFTLAEVFSVHPKGGRKQAFTLAEVFSVHPKGGRKQAFTLAEVFSVHPKGGRNQAFTLAEVLITLGIIGVVAAMTLPTLIQKHQKNTVATKLEKFYSTINQAVRMAEIEYGDAASWTVNELPRYVIPHLNATKIEELHDVHDTINVYFVGGGAVTFSNYSGLDIVYYINGQIGDTKNATRNKFAFQFKKNSGLKYQNNNFIEPWVAHLDIFDGTIESLTKGTYACAKNSVNPAYCTKWIQMSGWKIPDNYPW